MPLKVLLPVVANEPVILLILDVKLLIELVKLLNDDVVTNELVKPLIELVKLLMELVKLLKELVVTNEPVSTDVPPVAPDTLPLICI